MKTIAAIAAVTGLLFGLTACSNPSQESAPEPETASIVTGVNTHILQMPDGFRNVAFTCYGSNGVYVTSRGAFQNGNSDFTPLASSVFVVPNDPHC